jgi:hypothetical protein
MTILLLIAPYFFPRESCDFLATVVIPTGAVMGLRPTQGDEKAPSIPQPLSMEPLPFPLSSRAKPTCPGVPWRDLQFRGRLLEK